MQLPDRERTTGSADSPPVGRRCRRKPRRGYLYVAVLFTSLIVAGAIATALALDTARIKSQNAAADRGAALRLAETELHRVSVMLSTDPTWRDTLTDSVASGWTAYGQQFGATDAEARFTPIDGDGNLADDVFDDIQIVAQSKVGAAQAAISVVLETGFAPLEWLRYGVTTLDDIQIENGAAMVSERSIQVFDDCKTDTNGVITTPTLECSGRIKVSVRGDIASANVQSIGFDVVKRYENLGTEIPYQSLAMYNGERAIHLAVVSASTNPYGTTDSNGVYWIDAQGQPITIANARIVASIAIRNASRITLTGAISWESPGGAEAMLVTDSRIRFDALEPTLDETALAANFNPPATPYRGSDSNLSTTDRFPTEFRGILYSSRNIIINPTMSGDAVAITGAVICYDLILNHSLFIRSLDELLTNVPHGFADPTVQRFKMGTFRRVEIP